jgi:FkbM family methyltransferase
VWAHDSGRDKLYAASQLLRLVPSGLGAHAAARAVLARSMPLRPSLRAQKLAGGAKVQLDLSDRTQAQAYLLRRYEPDVVGMIVRVASPGGVFFDVGANIGLVTLSVGIRRRDLIIHAFEPDPANAERWRRNLDLNPGVQARLEEAAVSSKEGRVSMIRGRESGWSFVAKSPQRGGFDVRAVSLEAYASAHAVTCIDVLKVDVEGYEAEVLKGAEALLEQHAIRSIVCELNDSLLRRAGTSRSAVFSYLGEYGYAPRAVPGAGAQRLRRRSRETGQDFLFVAGSHSIT